MKILVQICVKIIDYGNTLLSFRSFLKLKHFEIQDIVISTISRITRFNAHIQGLHLETKLAICVEKQPINLIDSLLMTKNEFTEYLQTNTEAFELKMKKLLASWKDITYDGNISLAEAYEHTVQTSQHTSQAKLKTMYGLGEDTLSRVYMQKLPRTQPCLCGGYDCERSWWLCDFLEMFFRLGIDRTENWTFLNASVNQTPLLPEFYDEIRAKELPNLDMPVEKQYLIKQPSYTNRNKRKTSVDDSFGSQFESQGKGVLDNSIHSLASSTMISNYGGQRRQGLFRSYSAKELNVSAANEKTFNVGTDFDESFGSHMKKSVSFSNLPSELQSSGINKDVLQNRGVGQKTNIDEAIDEQSYSVLNYGPTYIQVSNLAIWLTKWADKFNKILMANSKTAAKFWHKGKKSSLYK